MTPSIGKFYNFKGQPELLVYIGKERAWHQFRRVGYSNPVWCEVPDGNLHMLEDHLFTYPKWQKFSSRDRTQPVCRMCSAGFGSKVDGLCTRCRGRNYWESYRDN